MNGGDGVSGPRLDGTRLPWAATEGWPRGLVMGVINVTPDSFSDGGRFVRHKDAFAHALALVEAGADILDLGGESTRPGSDPVSASLQLERVLPVIQALTRHFGSAGPALSIDTTSAEVAAEAIAAGATIVNDISAFRFDPAMLELLASTTVAACAMHTTAPPKTMQQQLVSGDVVAAVESHLRERIEACESSGIARTRLIIDPGIGFGKSSTQNLELIRAIPRLAMLGRPVLIGVSRKRFIGDITGRAPADRTAGTASAVAVARYLGAHILRVHDVAEMRDVIRVADALNS